MADKHDTPRTLKRRGLIAGAAALVAGITAKQASQPVRAATDMNFTASGGVGTAFFCGAGYSTGLSATGSDIGVYALGTNVGVSGNSLIVGVAGGDQFGSGTGVLGTMMSGTGVHGTSKSGVGVLGQSASSAGVEGLIPATSSAANTIGVFGNNLSTGANGIGIYGSCANGTGIYGQTSASYQYGVLGTTYAPSSTAIAGTCTGNGSSAFSGGTGNPNAFAAYFQGHVQIDGPFDVIGAGNKHAAVPHPDGSHRTIYSVESPEAWIEDFGTGTLAGGKATINLDADFAALIHTDDYHVFLTEHGGHHGLHTTTKSAGGFTVEASPLLLKAAGLSAAQASGAFSWRVVARPKTSAKVERLAKVRLADAKALLPDPAKLPKPPETPTVGAPTKKP